MVTHEVKPISNTKKELSKYARTSVLLYLKPTTKANVSNTK